MKQSLMAEHQIFGMKIVANPAVPNGQIWLVRPGKLRVEGGRWLIDEPPTILARTVAVSPR